MSAPPVSDAEFAARMAPLGPFAFPVVVGCSGGPDSLALAWLAHRWSGGRALAVVVDHGLRADSAAEAAGVVAQLEARGVPAALRRVAIAPGARLQERARAARRAALLDVCRERGSVHLLLGHQAEDQAETVLFRALRGSGPLGLAGMAPLAVAPQALILRPLLEVPRARLEATCAAAALRAVHDPSNADPRHARARLRAAGAGLPAAASAAFAARRARLEAALAVRAARCLSLRPQGCARLDLAALGRDEVARTLCGAVLRAVGGRAHAPPAAAVARLLAAGEGTLGGARLMRSGWVVRERPGAPIAAAAGSVWDGRFRLIRPAPGHRLGAAGRGAASAAHLPAAARAACPFLHAEGAARAGEADHLGVDALAGFARFEPIGGPVTAAGALPGGTAPRAITLGARDTMLGVEPSGEADGERDIGS